MLEDRVLQDIERMLSGDARALSRLITIVEDGGPEAVGVMRAVHPPSRRAYCVGVTGMPGAGKSTIVGGLTSLWRQQDRKVGVIAVDPTSPFSGGALLGDRIRMTRHYLDSGVFIRSMATRGEAGGLPLAVGAVARLLDASGKDIVAVETVGVGQAELRVMRVADTVVVVLTPESGDAVQTLKAGVLEVADVLVVNKADREGAARMVEALEASLQMGHAPSPGWTPPVLATQAHLGTGLDGVMAAIEAHRRWLESTAELARRRAARNRQEAVEMVEREVARLTRERLSGDACLRATLDSAERGERDPYSCANEILDRLTEGRPNAGGGQSEG